MNLRAFPKVELHRHLEGSVRYETYVDIAREAGRRPAPRAAIQVGRGARRSLASFLRRFTPFRGLYPSRSALERVARECIEDAARDRIEYLELRFSPVHFARGAGFDPTRTAEWIVEAARREARRHGMTVNFIATIARDFDARTNEPSVRAAAALRPAFVGLDVAGPESVPLDPLDPLIRRARRAGLRLTLHAGEGRGGPAILDLLRKYRPDRIGHGTRLRRIPPGVAVEVCLSSNFWTGACRDLRRHPLRRLFDAGIPISLNTDDPALLGIDLTHEYGIARRRLGFSPADLREINRRARASAFSCP